MSLDDARSWWNTEDDAHGAVPEEELLAFVKRESEAFDASIRRRDRRESIAAAVVFIAFALALALLDLSWLARAGAVIAMGGAVVVHWTLLGVRQRHEGRALGRSIAERIRADREKVDAQVTLLRRVLWWYIAPLGVGVVLLVYGLRGASWFTLGYAIVVVLFAAVVYHLNQRVVRRRLLPRRAHLSRLLRQVDD